MQSFSRLCVVRVVQPYDEFPLREKKFMPFCYSSLSYPLIARLALFSAAIALPLGASATVHPTHHHLSATKVAPAHPRAAHPSHAAVHSSVTGSHSRHSGSAAALHHASLATYRHRRSFERFTGNSFVDGDTTATDMTAGEDPVVRAAAISALGNMNGTVVAIDPSNGRILAMVNQQLALSGGAEPCSTIKVSVALAALQEGIITKDTPVNLGGSYHMTLTEALAHSNNLYFETLGRRLGFERVRHYANQFGLGELAGYNIAGETLGTYPDEELPEAQGGVGRMCSFGEGVSLTPLQLGALVASIANGGTLYYLQHPTTPQEVLDFQPKIKRTLDISKVIPEIQDGMHAATLYGTARSLRANFNQFPVMGKTGTCSNNGTRFGWFASYADTQYGRIVTVFFLQGGRPTFGPRAAELTGLFYRNLWDHSYFAQKTAPDQPTAKADGTALGVAQ
jgi:beta-lactamase class D